MSAELIARLEAATEGNTDLSWAIAEHVGWTKFWSGQTIFCPPGVTEASLDAHPEDDRAITIAPPFTTSLDAALTLVPESYAWSVQSSQQFPGQAWLYPPNNAADLEFQADAPPALAVCIAALKARAAGGGER